MHSRPLSRTLSLTRSHSRSHLTNTHPHTTPLSTLTYPRPPHTHSRTHPKGLVGEEVGGSEAKVVHVTYSRSSRAVAQVGARHTNEREAVEAVASKLPDADEAELAAEATPHERDEVVETHKKCLPSRLCSSG